MTGLLLPFKGTTPRIDGSAFIAETATVIGDVEISADAGIWYGCTVRGDVNYIRIGAGTNIQDGSVIHVTTAKHPTVIGESVTVGHMALLHGCTLQDKSFVGMHATVMDGAVVEAGAMVAAGALVSPGKVVRTGELWGGVPARCLRPMGETERAMIDFTAPHYVNLAREYLSARD